MHKRCRALKQWEAELWLLPQQPQPLRWELPALERQRVMEFLVHTVDEQPALRVL